MVTPVQPQQPSRIDNKIWRKRMNESDNHKAVCRTAPATSVLLDSCELHPRIARQGFQS